jgi:glycosyltransferase involved in cell wall biosynthesis
MTTAAIASLQHPAIRSVQNLSNRGASFSRNAGIEASRGELVTFLDDDDTYRFDKIELQVREMKRTNSSICFCEMRYADFRRHKRILPYRDLIAYHLKYNITGTPGIMASRDSLDRVGGLNVRLRRFQDADLILRLLLDPSTRACVVRKPLVTVHVSKNGIGASTPLLESRIEFLRDALCQAGLQQKHRLKIRQQISYIQCLLNSDGSTLSRLFSIPWPWFIAKYRKYL